jgi:L,D-transpeptidase ErfK/SrfK
VLFILLALALATAAGPSTDTGILTGSVHSIVTVRGDSLISLASRFGVDPRTIASDNGLRLDEPLRVGTTLAIDNRHVVPAMKPGQSMVVNLPQRMLFAATPGGIVGYPVAVGRSGWQTPLGEFSIVTKETDPTWDVPASILEEARRAGRSLPSHVPPGPNNPLGAYWLGLSLGSIGIHGTNAPSSIYRAVTHGCIRLRAEDVSALFAQVSVGATGELAYQPLLVAVEGDNVFVEAHRDVYARGPRDAVEFLSARARELGIFERIDWEAAARVIERREGVARVVTRR